MKDEDKTKEKLMNELAELHQRIAELEALEGERKRAVDAQRIAKEEYYDLYEKAPLGYHTVDSRGRITDMNKTELHWLGYTKEELIGKKTIFDIQTQESANRGRKRFQRLVKEGGVLDIELEFVRKDSSVMPVNIHASVLHNSKGEFIRTRSIVIDLTERKRAEERIERINIVLRAIRNVNQLITKEKDRDRLIKSICDILVETRGYHNAWIALLDDTGKAVKTAGTGFGKNFLLMHEQLKRGELPKCGINALRQSDMVVIEDTATTCVDCFLSKDCCGKGAMTIQLKHGKKVYGLLSAPIPMEFTPEAEEQSLFGEVAGDIAFALHDMELEEERKRAEEVLRESEEKIRDLFENMMDGLVVHKLIVDENGNPVDYILEKVNKAAEKILSWKREDIEGKRATEVYSGDTPFIERYAKVAQTGKSEYFVDYYPRFGRWYEITSFCPEKGYFANVFRDITERKKAEEKLAKIVDGSPIPAFVINSEHKITHWNTALESLTEVGGEDVVGTEKQWLPFYAHKRHVMADLIVDEAPESEFKNKYGDKYKKSALIEGAYEASDYFLTLGGKWLLFTAAPLKTSEGTVIGALETLQDITERKQAEEALRESDREHQTILDSLPIDIFYIGADGKFVNVNEALAKRYGMTPADFKGKTSKELFPELGDEYIESDKEVLKSGEPQTGVTRKIETPEGVKWVRLDKVPLKDADGNVTGIIGFELDITKRIQAQEELRNTHKELWDIIEFLPDATLVINRDKKVIAWNRAMEEMTGIRKEEIIGKGDYAYAVPFYGLRRPILIDLIFLSDKEIASHYKYVKKTGNAIFAETFISSLYGGKGAYLFGTATPLIDSEGNIAGAIESIRDITEREKAEEEIRKEKRFSENIVATVPDSLLVLDTNLRVKSANQPFYEKFRTAPGKVIGRSITDILRDEDGTLSTELTKLFGTEDMLENFELHYQSEKPGESERIFNITARGIIIAEEEEEEEEELVVLEDITERKRMDDKLRESEEKYSSLIESTDDSIYLVDRDCRYLFMNEKHLSRFGLPEDQVIGKTYGELHSPEETAEFAEKVEEVFETGKSVQQEHRSRRDNRYILRTLSPVKDSEGRVTAVTVISKDITPLKRVEEEHESLLKELEAKSTELEKAMKHMANLEEVTRMKSDFLSITSHELRTPLTPMKAQLQMLQEGYMGELNAKQGKSMKVILRNLTRLDKLIADILDISRIEAGRIKMIFKPMSFNEVVKGAIKMQEPSAEAQNIGISTEFADLSPIIGDVERLRQVIGNLISNAIKFSEPSGKVVIETKRSDLNGRESVQFSITDYGIGISKEDQTKLFKPFSQIDTSAGREHVGTGLGLAIAKGIVHAHEGKIWVESELGKSSTFYFAVPIKQELAKKEVSYL